MTATLKLSSPFHYKIQKQVQVILTGLGMVWLTWADVTLSLLWNNSVKCKDSFYNWWYNWCFQCSCFILKSANDVHSTCIVAPCSSCNVKSSHRFWIKMKVFPKCLQMTKCSNITITFCQWQNIFTTLGSL